MILDIHADIFSDVLSKKLSKESNIIRKYHLDKFKTGGVNGGIFVFWQDPYLKKYYNYEGLKVMMDYAKEEANLSKGFLVIAKNYEEYIKGLEDNKITAMMHLEGAKSLEDKLDKVKEIYDYGIRTASLTWNEENKLATGVKGNSNNGLKPMGKDFIKECENLGIIIDVSHANDKTFYDIYNTSTKPIIATHSNARELCNVKRNLLKEQIKLIKETDGIIGVNSYIGFISDDNNKRDLYSLINHIDYMVDLIGIDAVCFGFDYCDYLNLDEGECTKGLENASKTKNIITALKDRGYKNEDIEKISYKNFLTFINKNFGK
ncbi:MULTISPECIES: dipeptidase [unclassified Romboutsia]|uniref:dipeptidase n=1 Tax=unclassified Romboutsia TaxID=2626894 RepID=UPI0008216D2D|nr:MULTISPECIES: membrane dipeptidase [unclassified Romboutsia]SCG97136.1 Membrane dipeptidase (Peptidase family M19) [uncultured Clostridium sp.]